MATRGGSVNLAAGLQTLTSAIEITQDGALSAGQGASTIVKRGFTTGTGEGFINIQAADVILRDMVIDGDVTTPTGLQYGVDFGAPEDAPLITNTSVWVHGGTKRLVLENVTWQNTGGYAVFLDAQTDDIDDVIFLNCSFINCSPHLFGSVGGDLNYGSWTGGIFWKNTGSSGSGALRNLTIANCRWINCSGNGIWGHSNAFDINNKNVIVQGCSFVGQGLDCVEFGNVDGGSVTNCTLYRVGYINDVPKFDPGGLCATGIDSTGWVRNCTYSHNTIKSFNGHGMDLDGLWDSTVSNNLIQIPVSGDPDYTADQISSYGYSGSGNISVGINPGNTYSKWGGTNLSITSNTIKGCGYWSLTLGNVKNSVIAHNTIVHPSGAYGVPVIVFNKPNNDGGILTDGNGTTGTTADKDFYRSRGNLITDNHIEYGGSNFCIAEIEVVSGQVWLSTDINQVYGNIIAGSNYGEFQKHASSGSFVGLSLSTNDTAATSADVNRLMRDGHGSTGALKTISVISGTSKQVSQISDAAFLNVSVDGTAGTGSIATGNRGTLAWTDAVGTSKVAADGFISIASTTYSDTDADLLNNNYLLIRRNTSTGAAEVSSTTSGGHRVWVSLTGSSAAGSTGQVQFNGGSGAFSADANLTWTAGSKLLTITGTSSTSSLTVANGYITSDGGLYTASTSYESIKTPGGGFLGNSLSLASYIGMASNSSLASSKTSGDTWAAGTGLINFDSSSGTKLFFLRYGTGTSTYADAFLNAGGVNATSTSYQSIQTAGGMLATSYSVAKYVGMASNASLAPTSGDNWFTGGTGTGLINYDASSGTPLFFLRVGTGSSTYTDAFLHCAGLAATSTSYQSIQAVGGMLATSYSVAKYIGIASNASLSPTSGDNWFTGGAGTGLLNFDASSGTALFFLRVGTGSSTYADAFLHSAGVAATSTNYDSIQTAGGMHATNGYTSDQAVSLKTFASSGGLNNPGGGYGAIAHKSGSNFWYWNGSSWVTCDFSTVGGGVTTLTASTGISVSASTGAVTITNTGVTSVAGTTNQVSVSGSTGAVTLSLPQSIHTSATPTFSTLTLSSAATNALNLTSGSAQAVGFNATGSAYNSIQTASGMYAPTGFTSDQGVYLKTYASSGSLNTPAGGYGAIAHKAGSNFWYYNSGWQTVDFSSIGGGVTSLTGTSNQVNVSASTGAVTLSLPQSIHTSATPTFSTLTLSSAASNALNLTSGSATAVGFAATGSATNTIQASSGGVSAKYLIGTTSLTVTEDSSINAGSTTSGQHRLYADSTSHRLLLGWSGGSYSKVLVQSDLAAGSGLSLSGTTYTNTGVLSLGGFTGSLSLSASTGISVSGLTITNTGVTSLSAGTGVSVSGSTGSVTVSIGQAVSTSSNVTFASVSTSGVHQSSATGSSITFQNSNFNFQVDGNGNVSGAAIANFNSGYRVGGTTVIDSSRNIGNVGTVTASGNIQCGSSSNFGVAGGYFGIDRTGGVTCATPGGGSVTFYLKGGICYGQT